MHDELDLGEVALRAIAEAWTIDDGHLVWHRSYDDDPAIQVRHGFDWWPGKFRVSVTAVKAIPKEFGNAWRLVVRTGFLKNVPIDDLAVRRMICAMSSYGPSYCWNYAIPEFAKLGKDKYGVTIESSLDLVSTMYLREDSMSWAPDLCARLGVLQPIAADRLADAVAQFLGGTPHLSLPPGGKLVDNANDVLRVESDVYLQQGREASRWSDSEEFNRIAEQLGRSEACYGSGDSRRLTLETPFGGRSALIRLMSDLPHPQFGAGLLSKLELPIELDETDCCVLCSELDFSEASSWTDVPLLGSWRPIKSESGDYVPSHLSFFPNAVFQTQLTANVARWQIERAKWHQKRRWPDLKDSTMSEIYKERFGKLPDGWLQLKPFSWLRSTA